MKYAFEMGSSAKIYVPHFIMSGILKLIGEIRRHTDSMEMAEVYFYFIKLRRVAKKFKQVFY
jgi:hypothetical protein